MRLWQKAVHPILILLILLGLAGWLHSPGLGWRVETGMAASSLRPQVSFPIRQDRSPSLRSLSQAGGALFAGSGRSYPRLPLDKGVIPVSQADPGIDMQVQAIPVTVNMPATGFNFEGISNINGVLPPDTNGDIGPDHYVQWVNLSIAVWSIDRETKAATLIMGPLSGNLLWSGFGDVCEANNDGDPIVLYDHLADRWFISQFALPNFPYGPFYQCIAVSQTPDPTGAWHRYEYIVSNTKMNDYPKFGVWPDGYYMTVNQYNAGTLSPVGAAAVVYERSRMLLGLSARQVYFDLYTANPNYGGMLPADLDGDPPPPGSPNFFVEVDDSTWIAPTDALRLWAFRVNWDDPFSATFGLNGNPDLILPISNFIPLTSGVPQPNTSVRLDNLADRLMYRLQYRNFGGHETLVTNHTVDTGSGRAGVRWYELRRLPAGDWQIYQQGTFAGNESNPYHRWMGSAAMDSTGNLALGYSVSGNSLLYPSIAYAGRLASDPLNILPQAEALLQTGSGSQLSSTGRWGDYSMLSVDPIDQCTFWYTSEYLSITSNASWRTRIGSFIFPSCQATLKGSLAGTLANRDTGAPIAGALVSAGGYSTLTDAAGVYEFPDLPVGNYTVTASAYGYETTNVENVVISNNTTSQLNFTLAALTPVAVNGAVTDGSGQGWPLYARLEISASGFGQTLYTGLLDGLYTTDLYAGVAYTFQVNSVSPGYTPLTQVFTPPPGGGSLDFSLLVAPSCDAPGYDTACSPLVGALLVGRTLDENTSAGLPETSVQSVASPPDTSISFATPNDPAQPDGVYILFSNLTGSQAFSAAHPYYGTVQDSLVLPVDGISAHDFYLPAGLLQASPISLTETLTATQVITHALELSNMGGLAASFNFTEIFGAQQVLLPSGPFASATRHTSPKHLADLDASAVYEYVPPNAEILPGGALISAWSSGLAIPWGIGYDLFEQTVWIGNPAAGGGDDVLYPYSPDGTPGATSPVDISASGVYFMADLAYNARTRTFWQVSVSDGNCLVEVDPVLSVVTGRRICPPFDQSQRGLAYNPLDGSYYSGAWTDGILYHFNESGEVLDSANLNLNISGLAFNPATGHLFVLSNADLGLDVYVLDTAANYAILGGFDISGLGDFEQAGLELDCSGALWVANQVTGQVLHVESGELSPCTYLDVPWLSAAPGSGTIAAGDDLAITVTIDASLAAAGGSSGQLILANDTPYGIVSIPVHIEVSPAYDLSVQSDHLFQIDEPGEPVIYHFELTNTGSYTDSYLASASGNLWPVNIPDRLGPVAPLETLEFDIIVTIPEAVAPGAQDHADILIASEQDPALLAPFTLTTVTPLVHLNLPLIYNSPGVALDSY